MGFEILLCVLVEFGVFRMLYYCLQTQALQNNTQIIKQLGAGVGGDGDGGRDRSL